MQTRLCRKYFFGFHICLDVASGRRGRRVRTQQREAVKRCLKDGRAQQMGPAPVNGALPGVVVRGGALATSRVRFGFGFGLGFV